MSPSLWVSIREVAVKGDYNIGLSFNDEDFFLKNKVRKSFPNRESNHGGEKEQDICREL